MFELGMLVGGGSGFAAAWAMAFLGYRIAQTHAAEARAQAAEEQG